MKTKDKTTIFCAVSQNAGQVTKKPTMKQKESPQLLIVEIILSAGCFIVVVNTVPAEYCLLNMTAYYRYHKPREIRGDDLEKLARKRTKRAKELAALWKKAGYIIPTFSKRARGE